MPVFFHSADISFDIKNRNKLKKWIYSEIQNASFKPGEINIIFCSDNFLILINREFLKHDFYTDIITFNNNVGCSISGDLYISIDRVKENSTKYKIEFQNEIKRVIIHGILHLLGNDDNSPELKNEIHRKEDEALERCKTFYNE